MIYGTPSVLIDDDQTDRIGIRILILSLLWQPAPGDLSLIAIESQTPNTPDVPTGLALIGRQTRRSGGGLRTTWTFEGINGDGKSVTFKDRARSQDYHFDPGFSQVSLLKHPDWRRLKETYGGDEIDGDIRWPDSLPKSSGTIGLGDEGKGEIPNPMYGHDDFLRLEGTYSFRYASFNLTAPQSGVGKIHTSGRLPGEAPTFHDRDWLKAPVSYQRRGPVLDITETYWLSGPGGMAKTNLHDRRPLMKDARLKLTAQQCMLVTAARAEIARLADESEALSSDDVASELHSTERLFPVLLKHRALFEEVAPILLEVATRGACVILERCISDERRRRHVVENEFDQIIQLRSVPATVADTLKRGPSYAGSAAIDMLGIFESVVVMIQRAHRSPGGNN